MILHIGYEEVEFFQRGGEVDISITWDAGYSEITLGRGELDELLRLLTAAKEWEK